jgi:hypothetical protein
METNNPNVRESQEIFIKNMSKPIDTKGLQMSVSIDFHDTKLGFKNIAKPNYRKEYKISKNTTKHSVVFKPVPARKFGHYSCNFQLPDVLIPMKDEMKPCEQPKIDGSFLKDKKPKDKRFKYYRKDEYSKQADSDDVNKEVSKKKTAGRYDYLK